MKIHFWNIKNNKMLLSEVSTLFASQPNSLYAISEPWDINDQDVLGAGVSKFWLDPGRRVLVCNGVNTKSTFMVRTKYYSGFKIIYNKFELVLIVVHLKSKLSQPEIQKQSIRMVISQAKEEIKKFNNDKVIIIGDFNMNWYEEEMLAFDLFNSTNFFSGRELSYNSFEKQSSLKFYNPIASKGVGDPIPGTYFFRTYGRNHSWHLYDQALISFPLAKFLDEPHCGINTDINGKPLYTTIFKPDAKKYSDHFPIVIALK